MKDVSVEEFIPDATVTEPEKRKRLSTNMMVVVVVVVATAQLVRECCSLRGWIPHMVSVELLERVACAAHKVVNRLLVGHVLVAQYSQACRHHR